MLVFVTRNTELFDYQVQRARRSTKADPFLTFQPIAELYGLCVPANATIDLSADGLRAYLACYSPGGGGDLLVATRPSLEGAFVVAGPYGLVGASAAIADRRGPRPQRKARSGRKGTSGTHLPGALRVGQRDA